MIQNKHRPFHLELENEIYFLTAKCFEKANYFLGKERVVLNVINNLIKELGISLYAFAIITNHYHLLLKLGCKDGLLSVNPETEDNGLASVTPNTNNAIFWNDGRQSVNKNRISYFARRLNSLIAKRLNEIDSKKGRKVFYQYWDYCIKDEKDFFKIFNYIHQNPIKHGLVKNFDDLENFEFCSYKYWLVKKGKDFLFDCFYYYPANDINIED